MTEEMPMPMTVQLKKTTSGSKMVSTILNVYQYQQNRMYDGINRPEYETILNCGPDDWSEEERFGDIDNALEYHEELVEEFIEE